MKFLDHPSLVLVLELGNAVGFAHSASSMLRAKSQHSITWSPNASNPEIVIWNGCFVSTNWNFNTASMPFENCVAPNARRCRITTSPNLATASAVLVHSRTDFNQLPPEHPEGQKYVLFDGESPEHLNEDQMKELAKVKFDWLATYRLDSDVPAPYGWLIKRSSNAPAPATLPPVDKRKKALWVASNCVTNDRREDVVQALQMAGVDVEILGQCGSDDPCKKGDTECNIALMNSYKFVFAFENSRCKGYITEKFWEAMRSAAVPVVLGAPRSDYLAVAPQGSFVYIADYIDQENGDFTRAALFLNKLAGSPNRLKKYKWWQNMYDVARPHFLGDQNFAGEYTWWCHLCSRLVDGGRNLDLPMYQFAGESSQRSDVPGNTSQGSDLLGFLYRNDCDPSDDEIPPFRWKDEAAEESQQQPTKS